MANTANISSPTFLTQLKAKGRSTGATAGEKARLDAKSANTDIDVRRLVLTDLTHLAHKIQLDPVNSVVQLDENGKDTHKSALAIRSAVEAWYDATRQASKASRLRDHVEETRLNSLEPHQVIEEFGSNTGILSVKETFNLASMTDAQLAKANAKADEAFHSVNDGKTLWTYTRNTPAPTSDESGYKASGRNAVNTYLPLCHYFTWYADPATTGEMQYLIDHLKTSWVSDISGVLTPMTDRLKGLKTKHDELTTVLNTDTITLRHDAGNTTFDSGRVHIPEAYAKLTDKQVGEVGMLPEVTKGIFCDVFNDLITEKKHVNKRSKQLDKILKYQRGQGFSECHIVQANRDDHNAA